MLKVLFPVAYWDAHQAALEGARARSLHDRGADGAGIDVRPAIKSHANAVGLMQILPSTGSRYAKRIGLRRFRPSMLTQPDINIRLGTAIFSDMVARFDGGTHLALASYNAGEGAVARWVSERPGIARDEFIDDIPYPETQNYVKKIVGTAEDYRRLYGELGATGLAEARNPPPPRCRSPPGSDRPGRTTAATKADEAAGEEGGPEQEGARLEEAAAAKEAQLSDRRRSAVNGKPSTVNG